MDGQPSKDSERPATPGAEFARRRRSLIQALARSAATFLAVLVLYYVLPLDGDFSLWTVVVLLVGIVVVGGLVAWQVRAIVVSGQPVLQAVQAVALTLPLFLLLFAATYYVQSEGDAGAFSEPLTRTDSLYFVVTVFATVGFGDISPVTEPARVLTTLQMVGDLVLVGIVLRIVVQAVQQARRRSGITIPPDTPVETAGASTPPGLPGQAAGTATRPSEERRPDEP